MHSYDIAPLAEEDLIDIWFYSDERWGESQADRYLSGLHDCFESAVAGQKSTKHLKDIHPLLESCRCEKHVVFFIRNTRPVIIAVFHERMQLMHRLRQRLTHDH